MHGHTDAHSVGITTMSIRLVDKHKAYARIWCKGFAGADGGGGGDGGSGGDDIQESKRERARDI